MADQELLLLQILKIPVIIIKYLAKGLSILTYLPNYLVLYVVDHLLFSPQYQSSLQIYSALWLPKIALLMLGLSIFCLQFYGIFAILELEQHGLIIQTVGMLMTLAGLLILMRKGYLSLIEKYNLSKLKSVQEHILVAYEFFIDIVGIILAVLNILLIVNSLKTLDYQYSSKEKYRFLKHISKSIRQSIIFYIECFYVRIFFRIFPWRFRKEEETYLKEKQANNVLNCMVLLTLLFLSTLIDLLIVIIFGLPNVIHFKRNIYLKSLSQTHAKWKVTLNHFIFICLHSVQLSIQIVIFPVCPKQTIQCIKKLWAINQADKLFGEQFKTLVLKFFLRVPYLICNSFIFISYYKYKRRNMLVSRFNEKNVQISKSEHKQKRQTILQFSTFKCFRQLCFDICFTPLILIATVLQPWRILWVRYLLTNQYELKRKEIMIILVRGSTEWMALPFCIILSLLLAIYYAKGPLQIFKQTHEYVEKDYVDRVNRGKKQLDPLFPYTDRQIFLVQYVSRCFLTLKTDFPHLPLFFITKTTFLSIYDCNLLPKTSNKLIFNLLRQYYRRSVVESPKGKFYSDMYTRMLASGNIQGPSQEFKFWRVAYKCQKLILFQKIAKFFLTKRQIQRINQKLKKGNSLSEISNEFWYQSQLLKAYVLRFVYLIIQIIVSIIGFIFLLPLTLWRLPTFVKLYAFHRNKIFFFKILFSMYRQMFEDFKYLPIKLIGLMMAPKMLISFCYKTSFKYGPAGMESFSLYQKAKKKYLVNQIIESNILPTILNFEIIFIYTIWIRIKNLRTFLRRQKLTTFKVYTDLIFTSPSVPSIQQIVDFHNQNQGFQDQLRNVLNGVHEIFKESLRDVPYLIVIAVLFVTMPWRFNYIIQAIKDTRDDRDERKSFIKLLRNIFKDYMCIIMNLVLLFSGFKTRKAILLIRRNYRLNFFIGFLEYSYFNELVKEMKNLGLIYVDVIYGIVALLFGWTRADLLVRELLEHRKKIKQEEQSANANLKIYENTVKSGKQLQLLNKMGFYNYLNVCSYLSVSDIISLRKVDKLNYQMSRKQEVWFTKWESLYASKHNFIDDQFESRCQKAYILQNSNQPRQIASYHTIVMHHYKQNVERNHVDLAVFAHARLPTHIYEKIFKYYSYRLDEGYGPENQLPQADDEDEEFLRLTNQVRRPKVFLNQNLVYGNWLGFKPVEIVIQAMTRYFRVNQNRRLKQLIIVLMFISTVSVLLVVVFKFLISILWLQDSFIGLRIIFLIYLWCLMFLFVQRYIQLYPTWISLIPFDLKQDVIQFFKFVGRQIIKKRMIDPTTNLLKKIGRFIKKVLEKIARIIQKILNKLKQWGQKTASFTVKTSKTIYYRVLKPLYIKIADYIRKIIDALVFAFRKIFKAFKTVFQFIYRCISTIFHSVYNAIYAVFSNINKLYYLTLKSSMEFLLRFGLLGNLVFTFWGLFLMTLPSWIWWFFYHERWYLIVSSIHTMVLIVIGYKHLQRIRNKQK